MEKHLHIVCLDVPYPPDYGGVFDLFWKLKYLKQQGVKIILHCFEYGRGQQPALQSLCEHVYYYKRKRGIMSLSFRVPYIVRSRVDRELVKNLQCDQHPILLEGTHCTWLLWKNIFPDRKVLLRLHNMEADYYRQLWKNTNSFLKKKYYGHESRLLSRYEPAVISKASIVLTVTEKDAVKCKQIAGIKQVQYLPVFTGWNKVTAQTGTGNYCLYHGNLSVDENEAAAMWLIQSVFAGLDIPLKIAGKNPSQKLEAAAAFYAHIELIRNPDEKQMERLITDAHINLLPSFSSTGIKLKLLHALFCGRYCIANTLMTQGTEVKPACVLAENEREFQAQIENIFHQPFTNQQITLRQQLLDRYYNNQAGTALLIKHI
ncbi:MAG: glycosyltransferase [Chitinophagaceae bacterium]|nr:glycosyltransferase [Chitinophagaceae bacterium]